MSGAAAPTANFIATPCRGKASQTVLDVVTWIQRRLDPSLAYRFACRVGMCGSCAMTVNGVARWTCRTHVETVVQGGSARDRAAGQSCRSCATWSPTCANSSTNGRGPRVSSSRRRRAMTISRQCGRIRRREQAIDAAIECIGCGVCYSACDVVAWNPDYLGPAALNRAWTLQRDVRDGAHDGAAGCRGRRRRLPRVPHACQLHRALPEAFVADRIDRRPQARDRAGRALQRSSL